MSDENRNVRETGRARRRNVNISLTGHLSKLRVQFDSCQIDVDLFAHGNPRIRSNTGLFLCGLTFGAKMAYATVSCAVFTSRRSSRALSSSIWAGAADPPRLWGRPGPKMPPTSWRPCSKRSCPRARACAPSPETPGTPGTRTLRRWRWSSWHLPEAVAAGEGARVPSAASRSATASWWGYRPARCSRARGSGAWCRSSRSCLCTRGAPAMCCSRLRRPRRAPFACRASSLRPRRYHFGVGEARRARTERSYRRPDPSMTEPGLSSTRPLRVAPLVILLFQLWSCVVFVFVHANLGLIHV